MNSLNQPKFSSKGISTLIRILIIVTCAFLAGGILAWQYLKMPKEEIPENEIAERILQKIIVTSDKAEYEREEIAEFTILNNSSSCLCCGMNFSLAVLVDARKSRPELLRIL